jgi:hypothetical protein
MAMAQLHYLMQNNSKSNYQAPHHFHNKLIGTMEEWPQCLIEVIWVDVISVDSFRVMSPTNSSLVGLISTPLKLHRFLVAPCVVHTPLCWALLVHYPLWLHRLYFTFGPCVTQTHPLTTWLVHPSWLHRFLVAPWVIQIPPPSELGWGWGQCIVYC